MFVSAEGRLSTLSSRSDCAETDGRRTKLNGRERRARHRPRHGRQQTSPAPLSVATSSARFLSCGPLFRARGVVPRIDIVDVKRTLAAYLHHRRGLRGRVMVLLRRQIVVAAGLHRVRILGDGVVAHPDV